MKKLLSVLLASATALSLGCGLVACTPDSGSGGIAYDDTVGTLPTGAVDVTIWCPDGAIEVYTELANEFKSKHEEAKDWNITFEAKTEGDASSAVRTDPTTGPCMYFLASDQIPKQVEQACLQPLIAPYIDKVLERDDQGAIDTMHMKDPETGEMEYYAFPNANSNGYFLIYDTQFYTEEDVKSLDTMVSKADEAGKKIIFNYNDGFYNPTFFFGMDVSLGDQASGGQSTINLKSEKGYEAGRTYLKYFGTGTEGVWASTGGSNSAIATGFEGGTVVAGILGTWVNEKNALYNMAENTEGWSKERIGFAKLPMFTDTQGNEYQMGSFMGAKYCGVNPAKSENQIYASLALADYFNQGESQAKRFLATGDAPTNKVAAADSRVANDKMISALVAQNAAGGHMQLDTPSEFWKALEAFGNGIYNGSTTSANINDQIDALDAAMKK